MHLTFAFLVLAGMLAGVALVFIIVMWAVIVADWAEKKFGIDREISGPVVILLLMMIGLFTMAAILGQEVFI